jgi:hypothetical protein
MPSRVVVNYITSEIASCFEIYFRLPKIYGIQAGMFRTPVTSNRFKFRTSVARFLWGVCAFVVFGDFRVLICQQDAQIPQVIPRWSNLDGIAESAEQWIRIEGLECRLNI